MPSIKATKHALTEVLKENEGSDKPIDVKEAIKDTCFTLANEWEIEIEEGDYK